MKKIDKMREGFPPSLFKNRRALSFVLFSQSPPTHILKNITEPFHTDFFLTPTANDNVGYCRALKHKRKTPTRLDDRVQNPSTKQNVT
jgi:hypothetical protein